MSGRPNDFSKGVKIAAKARATHQGKLFCEGCGHEVTADAAGTFDVRIDHIIAAGLRGSSALNNAQCLGKCCYAEKDAHDNAVVKRAQRIERKHLGIDPAISLMQSRGFPPRPERASRCGPTSKTIARRQP